MTATRRWLIERALKVYRSFGYLPIETPALERAEILRGKYGEEGDKLRYQFEDNGGREVGLRYDLTVPFARFIARFLASGEIRLPFRRSQAQPVYRAESPQAGRFREFWQCDYDLAGADSIEADAEALIVAVELAKELGFNYIVKINSRPLLEAILDSLGIADQNRVPIFLALDKKEKLSMADWRQELEKAGVEKLALDRLIEAISISDLDKLTFNEAGEESKMRLLKTVALAKKSLDDPDRLQIDLSLVRGLSYYTGIVFEAIDQDETSLGSFLGGGRYDEVVGEFAGRRIPAVGASTGVDRAIEILAKKNILPEENEKADLAVLPLEGQEEMAFELAAKLRQTGASVVLAPQAAGVGEQLGFATRVAEWALIVGEQEVKSGQYQLKDLSKKQQKTVSLSEVEDLLRQRIS